MCEQLRKEVIENELLRKYESTPVSQRAGTEHQGQRPGRWAQVAPSWSLATLLANRCPTVDGFSHYSQHQQAGAHMNRLRRHLSEKPTRRLQSAIVAEYHDDIIELIAVDRATLPDVANAVRAEGEPVLDAGFKAEILRQIGTVKAIRAGQSKPAARSRHSDPPPLTPNSNREGVDPPRIPDAIEDDHDDDFVARRPRR